MMKNKQFQSSLILLLTAAIWGFAFVAQVDAAEKGLGAFSYTGVRFLLGAASLIPVVLIFEREKITRTFWHNTVRPAILSGVVLFIAATLQQLGINMEKNAGKASFITGFYIILVPIASLLFNRRKTAVTVWIGAVVALIGLYFLGVTPGETVSFGDVLVFASAFFWTTQILIIDRFVGKASPIKFSMVQFIVTGILGLIFAAFTEDLTVGALIGSWQSILYAGICSCGIAYTCQVIGQKHCDPTVATIIMSLESVFGALGGLMIGNKLSGRGWLGCGLMFVGILLAQIPPKKTQPVD